MTKVAIGTRAVPAKTAAMPTTAKAEGSSWAPGRKWSTTKATQAPTRPPIYTFGPKTPPEPPEEMVNDIATIFIRARKIKDQPMDPPVMAFWTHPYPVDSDGGNHTASNPMSST